MNLAQLETAHRAADDLRQVDRAANDVALMTASKIEITLTGESVDSLSRKRTHLVVPREEIVAWLAVLAAKREAKLKELGVTPS